MRKIVILIIVIIFNVYIYTSCNVNSVVALQENDELCEGYIAHLYLEKEIYNLDDEIYLTIYMDVESEKIVEILCEENGFNIIGDFLLDDMKITFKAEYDLISSNPYLEIILQLEEKTLKVNLFGTIKDDLLFINPYSYEEANQVYLYYLKTNDYLKYEIIQSEQKPLSINNDLQSYNESSSGQELLGILDQPDTFISGEFKWIDDFNVEHPLMFTLVQLWDKEPIGERLLMETYTNENGQYSFAFDNATGSLEFENGGYDIFIRVIPAGEDVVVYRGNGSEYYEDMGYYENCPSGTLEPVSDTFHMNDGMFAKALQVSQAAIYASMYYREMKGTDVEDVEILFPHNEQNNGCFYRNSTKTIYILNSNINSTSIPESYASWDVIMHEYGHHISYQEDLTDSPNGGHGISTSMAEHYHEHFSNLSMTCNCNCVIDTSSSLPFSEEECKYNGLAIAWSEGIATYFSMAIQEYYSVYLQNVKYTNNGKYDAYNFNIPLEIENAYGTTEDCESTVFRLLYDIFDEGNNEYYDSVSLEHQQIFNLLITSEAKTLSQFLEYLYTNYSNDKIIFSEIGELLYNHGLVPQTPYVQGDISFMTPTFSWAWFENSNAKFYKDRSFALRFYNYNRNLIYETDVFNFQSYTLSNSEWTTIINSGDYFYVSVVIYENHEPVTFYESEWTSYSIPYVDNIYLNNPQTKTFIGGDCFWFVFQAPQSATYTFESTGIIDTYVDIFNSKVGGTSVDGLLTWDDNSGDLNNFSIDYYLNQGQKIYIRVRTYGWNQTGNFTINVSPSGHWHNYTHSYMQMNADVHTAFCECGEAIHQEHLFVQSGFKLKCEQCGYTTIGSITPIASNENELYLGKNEEIEFE